MLQSSPIGLDKSDMNSPFMSEEPMSSSNLSPTIGSGPDSQDAGFMMSRRLMLKELEV